MSQYYSDEKNVQILVSLLKAHGVRNVIASPGSANSPLVASFQRDPDFKMISCVDERSAAYMACGWAAESKEVVVLTCTGATASRNYMPGLTEAFYRKLPILAITSTQPLSRVGHHFAQVLDRSNKPRDVAKMSVTLPVIKDDDDVWDCELKVNTAVLALWQHGGGPVHINLETNSLRTYTTKHLPAARVIRRYRSGDQLPTLPHGRVGVFVGSHGAFAKHETEALDRFCEANNGVVFCDHTSSYAGKYRVQYSLVSGQIYFDKYLSLPKVLIYIGEISGDYASLKLNAHAVWRVSEDGILRDTFRRLENVFEMPEQVFFNHYAYAGTNSTLEYFEFCRRELTAIRNLVPDLPFSNIWIASMLAPKLPEHSVIHFGILNSLRSWNFFELPQSVQSASNVGGFGIDGCLSSLIGASFHDHTKLYFCVLGDLAFFYDLNALGNRHISNNLRILIINNGLGTEFKQYNHHTSHFGDEADSYISAKGHFGSKSPDLVRHFAQNLGFTYLSASTKNEFNEKASVFVDPSIREHSMVFEVFTDSVSESKALEMMLNIEKGVNAKAKSVVKDAARKILGPKAVGALRKTFKV